MSDAPLAALAARADRLAGWGRKLLVAAGLVWMTGMLFYDPAVDPRWDAPTILLPSELSYLRIWAGVDPLPVRRIWGGPATLGHAQLLAELVLAIGLFLIGRLWLRGRAFSWRGAAIFVAGLLLYLWSLAAQAPIGWAGTITPGQFDTILARLEARQPGLVAALRDGRDLRLREGSYWGPMTVVQAQGWNVLRGDPAVAPIQAAGAAEALRFALAQQAMLNGDRAALRRLLPLRRTDAWQDTAARNDIGRRALALERFAGMPAAGPGERPAIAAAGAAWQRIVALVRLDRLLVQLLLLAGLGSLVAAWRIRRRLKRIGRSMAAIGGVAATPAG